MSSFDQSRVASKENPAPSEQSESQTFELAIHSQAEAGCGDWKTEVGRNYCKWVKQEENMRRRMNRGENLSQASFIVSPGGLLGKI